MTAQVDNGKGFEWAIADAIHAKTGAKFVKSKEAANAWQAFKSLGDDLKGDFVAAASVAVAHILEHEGVATDGAAGSGRIRFNGDRAGAEADVRDVILELGNRILGISCKNNHFALKHSRLSGTVDFIRKWGIDERGCGGGYMAVASRIFGELERIRSSSCGKALWDGLEDKVPRFYAPLLDAWCAEIERTIGVVGHEKFSKALVSYLIGNVDFYKAICRPKDGSVIVQAYNVNGTMTTGRVRLPTRVIEIGAPKLDGEDSSTTRIITFDGGWSVKFRIHNASSRVEPSLKFDIALIGCPSDSYMHRIAFKTVPRRGSKNKSRSFAFRSESKSAA